MTNQKTATIIISKGNLDFYLQVNDENLTTFKLKSYTLPGSIREARGLGFVPTGYVDAENKEFPIERNSIPKTKT